MHDRAPQPPDEGSFSLRALSRGAQRAVIGLALLSPGLTAEAAEHCAARLAELRQEAQADRLGSEAEAFLRRTTNPQ